MNGFISYAHDDVNLVDGFRPHLRAIERGFRINFWSDPRTHAGQQWTSEISKRIDDADVFILLISPNSIASEYIYEKEMPAIKARRRDAAALVIPVVLSRCCWPMVADELEPVPTVAKRLKPIADWRPRDHGFDCARAQIGEAVKAYFGIAPIGTGWTSQ